MTRGPGPVRLTPDKHFSSFLSSCISSVVVDTRTERASERERGRRRGQGSSGYDLDPRFEMVDRLPLPEGKVKLVSGDGSIFIVDEDAARVSATLRGMLDSEGDFLETASRTIHLKEISARALERCCSYFYYKLEHISTPSRSIPKFEVAPELALELLMASNYLDM